MSAPGFRVWLGWRKAQLNFDQFRKHLEDTFVPATWQLMHDFHLQAYLPSLLHDGDGAELPHETALLIYRDSNDWQASRSTPVGRAYGMLHGTVFDRSSRSEWAVAPGETPTGKVSAWVWPGGGSHLLASGKSVVAYLVLRHAGGSLPDAQAVHAALGDAQGQAVICRDGALSYVWLAGAAEGAVAEVKRRVEAAQPEWRCVVANAARPAHCPIDATKAPTPPIELPPDTTLHFAR